MFHLWALQSYGFQAPGENSLRKPHHGTWWELVTHSGQTIGKWGAERVPMSVLNSLGG